MEIKHRSELHKLIPANAVVAEIGCAEGNFSRDILNWGVAKLYLVDAWTKLDQSGDGGFDQAWHDKNFNDCMERIKPFAGKFQVLRGLSYRMALSVPDASLDMVYLDADHSYEGVIRDLGAWYPKVKDGGIIAGHDYMNFVYGVNRAVNEFCSANRYQVIEIPENHPSDASFWFRK